MIILSSAIVLLNIPYVQEINNKLSETNTVKHVVIGAALSLLAYSILKHSSIDFSNLLNGSDKFNGSGKFNGSVDDTVSIAGSDITVKTSNLHSEACTQLCNYFPFINK
jgi:hypothetical protein